jgi:secreted PhoX family phosphatase
VFTRREAIKRSAAAAAGASTAGTLLAMGGVDAVADVLAGKPGYGRPVHNPKAKALKLPRGFSYTRFGKAGSRMSDGLETPPCHDGTGTFAGDGTTCILIRNHEGFGPGKALGKHNAYDPVARGGVTSSHFDTSTGRLVGSALVLNGTDTNCNGGVTPWGTWLSAEESTVGAGNGFEAEHGYVFEVPASATAPVDPVPIKAMGRFVHEATPVDPRTGIVYLTEDNGDPGDGFYRYIPNQPGNLLAGGRLEMLAIEGMPGYNTAKSQRVGEALTCAWVPIDDPDPSDAEKHPDAVYRQGAAKGAVRFLGLEGAFFSQDSIYTTASEAGDAKKGQIWRYTPDLGNLATGALTLLFESPSARKLDEPDGLAVSPRGGIVLAEDGSGEEAPNDVNFLRGLSPSGKVFDFARNERPLILEEEAIDQLQPFNKRYWQKRRFARKGDIIGSSEFSGVAYSPDGRWLFASIQYPGATYAITGPWEKGWL